MPGIAASLRPAAPAAQNFFDIFPAAHVSLVPPRTIESARSVYPGMGGRKRLRRPAAWVIALPGGRFDGRLQDVTTAGGELLTEQAFYSATTAYQEAMERLHLPALSEAPRRLPGNAAVIASLYSDSNYFHWLFNALPRFELLRRAGLPPERADWYILAAPPRAYHLETLEALRIPLEKIIVVGASQHSVADRLWATRSLRAPGQCSAWVANFLRDLLLEDTPRGRLRLYVGRKDTPRHPLVNELEIESWLIQRGFQSVLPGRLTVREQARLFAQAEVVVAPNGAGLANLVFCPTGTKVFELFSPQWLGTYSWEVASLRQQEYYYLIGERSQQRTEYGAYHIALPDLARLLALAGI